MNSEKIDVNSWMATNLWLEIEKRQDAESDSIRTTLKQCMPDIEMILAKGGTASLEFTLHDSGHAFRVAQRMTQVIPSDVLPALSIYELALLLLSAYLHDIGMSPERKRVLAHYDYLLTGTPGALSPTEVEQFQQWLDDEAEGVVPPIASGTPRSDILRKAGELTAYYSRFRHNEWSEQWIRQNLHDKKLGAYGAWLEDLVTLCKSHHEGYLELAGADFNPRIVGHLGAVVHLRFLAVALRVADVLEFDPERTPEVILRHRDIPPSSVIFWWKDHEISSIIEGNHILISARPPTARIHQAILSTIEQVNAELVTCRRLADNIRFQSCPGLDHDLPHHWEIASLSHSTVQPLADSYEYIDGSFRPNTGKLLQLFSGTELYGDPLVAVRELLQNAFDAVREQIAYERLAKPDPSSSDLEQTLGNLHQVMLRVEPSADGLTLVCRDDGVGMTKSIIQDHLLVSGASKRHDVLKLKRECESHGFSLGTTGEFGIGVLSYFMLADHVSIKTRRGQEARHTEMNGWRFETEGIGAFGELRKASDISRGTEVRLRLRRDIVAEDPAKWYEKLGQYVENLLVRIPCKFTLNAGMPACRELSFNWGWVLTEANRLNYVVNCVRDWNDRSREDVPIELLPASHRQQLEAKTVNRLQVLDEFKSRLRFEVHEVELDGGNGRARIHIPYFDLPGGSSLKFLRVHSRNSKYVLEKIGAGYTLNFEMPVRSAWKGMSASASSAHDSYQHFGRRIRSEASLIELDWVSSASGRVSVSRDSLTLTEAGTEIFQTQLNKARDLRAEIYSSNEDSMYAWLNARTVGRDSRLKGRINWLSLDDPASQRHIWAPLKFPAISALAFAYSSEVRLVHWKGKPVTIVRCLGGPTDFDVYGGDSWNSVTLCPDYVLPLFSRASIFVRFRLAPVWTQPKTTRKVDIAGMTSKFPPGWTHICGVSFRDYARLQEDAVVWNPAHRLLGLVSTPGWEWCLKKFEELLDPLPVKDQLLSDISRAASWVLMCLERGQRDLWNGLRDRDPNFLGELWKVLSLPNYDIGPEKSAAVFEWVENSSDSGLREISPDGWRFHKASYSARELAKYLPKVDPRWSLEESQPTE